MKRFRFPLKSVVTVRHLRDRQAWEDLAGKVHHWVAAKEELARTEARVAEVETILRDGRLARIRPSEEASFLAAYHNELAGIGQAEGVVDTAKQAMDESRLLWLSRRRELRAIEKLETRAKLRHRADADRAEQKEMDELAGIRAGRVGREWL